MNAKQAQTKAHNYLLRSTHGGNLARFAVLVSEGLVRHEIGNVYHLTKRDDSWAGDATWEGRMFVAKGLARAVKGRLVLTREGEACLIGAFAKLPGLPTWDEIMTKHLAQRIER